MAFVGDPKSQTDHQCITIGDALSRRCRCNVRMKASVRVRRDVMIIAPCE